MMPIPGRCGDWEFDFYSPRNNETSLFQFEQTFHIGSDFYPSLPTSLPGEDLWKKFDLNDDYIPIQSYANKAAYPLSDSSTDDDCDHFDCSAVTKDAREIRHHDCMWAGRCGSKDHKKIVVSETPVMTNRPTVRKTSRTYYRKEDALVAVPRNQAVFKSTLPRVQAPKSVLKNEVNLVVNKTNGRSLLRTPVTNHVVAISSSVKKDYGLESDGDSLRPDTPLTSESEDDNDEHLVFKHNLDMGKSVSVVCSSSGDDSADQLAYNYEYRTQNSTSSGASEFDDDDDDDDDEEEDDDESTDECGNNDDADEKDLSTPVAVSDVTGQRRPTSYSSMPVTPVKMSHYTSDHSYHQSKNVVRLDNLGVQTPSDSEEEIDVVSFCEGGEPTSRSSSCGGTSLPTNPSDSDRKHLQQAVKSAITKKQKKKDVVPNDDRQEDELDFRMTTTTIKKEPVEAKTAFSGKVKNTKKRPATGGDRDDEKNRFKGVKRAKHTYHHRLQHHKMITPQRSKKASSTGSNSPRSGCGSSDSEPESLERRSLHNNMERQRRVDLRNLVEGLRMMVPSVENKCRAAKVIILREASNYCQDLTEQYEESTSELAALRQKQNKLRQRVSALRREAAKIR